jgi:hypothetical protein
MKKIYWIVPLVLVILAIVIIGYVKNSQNNITDQNLCQHVISLNDIRNMCEKQNVKEDNHESYYITQKNTTAADGNTYGLDDGEFSRCLKSFKTQDYELMSNKGSSLTFVISALKSKESASKYYDDTLPIFNESNEWEKASKDALVLNEDITTFGEKGNIAVFKATDAFIQEQNMTIHLSKVAGISFLKENRVIWIQSASYNQSTPLLCELEGLKKLAAFVDKKIN